MLIAILLSKLIPSSLFPFFFISGLIFYFEWDLWVRPVRRSTKRSLAEPLCIISDCVVCVNRFPWSRKWHRPLPVKHIGCVDHIPDNATPNASCHRGIHVRSRGTDVGRVVVVWSPVMFLVSFVYYNIIVCVVNRDELHSSKKDWRPFSFSLSFTQVKLLVKIITKEITLRSTLHPSVVVKGLHILPSLPIRPSDFQHRRHEVCRRWLVS